MTRDTESPMTLKPTDQGRPMAGMDFECGIFCEEKAA